MAQVDKKIGEKIKALRKAVGISQIELAERIGISFQQIQKYEKGTSRISVLRLQQIAKALGTNISSFFETENTEGKVSDHPLKKYPVPEKVLHSPLVLTEEEMVILKLYRKIKNKKVRETIRKLLKGVIELENK